MHDSDYEDSEPDDNGFDYDDESDEESPFMQKFETGMGDIGEEGRAYIPGIKDLCQSFLEPTERGPITIFVNTTYWQINDLYDDLGKQEEEKTAIMKGYFESLCRGKIDFTKDRITIKNPFALYLGYVSSRMEEINIKEAMSYLNASNLKGVTKIDIIRYARFWQKVDSRS